MAEAFFDYYTRGVHARSIDSSVKLESVDKSDCAYEAGSPPSTADGSETPKLVIDESSTFESVHGHEQVSSTSANHHQTADGVAFHVAAQSPAADAEGIETNHEPSVKRPKSTNSEHDGRPQGIFNPCVHQSPVVNYLVYQQQIANLAALGCFAENVSPYATGNNYGNYDTSTLATCTDFRPDSPHDVCIPSECPMTSMAYFATPPPSNDGSPTCVQQSPVQMATTDHNIDKTHLDAANAIAKSLEQYPAADYHTYDYNQLYGHNFGIGSNSQPQVPSAPFLQPPLFTDHSLTINTRYEPYQMPGQELSHYNVPAATQRGVEHMFDAPQDDNLFVGHQFFKRALAPKTAPPSDYLDTNGVFRKLPTCAKCRGHGRIVRLKNHECPYKHCRCALCVSVNQRRSLMKWKVFKKRHEDSNKVNVNTHVNQEQRSSVIVNTLQRDQSTKEGLLNANANTQNNDSLLLNLLKEIDYNDNRNQNNNSSLSYCSSTR